MIWSEFDTSVSKIIRIFLFESPILVGIRSYAEKYLFHSHIIGCVFNDGCFRIWVWFGWVKFCPLPFSDGYPRVEANSAQIPIPVAGRRRGGRGGRPYAGGDRKSPRQPRRSRGEGRSTRGHDRYEDGGKKTISAQKNRNSKLKKMFTIISLSLSCFYHIYHHFVIVIMIYWSVICNWLSVTDCHFSMWSDRPRLAWWIRFYTTWVTLCPKEPNSFNSRKSRHSLWRLYE